MYRSDLSAYQQKDGINRWMDKNAVAYEHADVSCCSSVAQSCPPLCDPMDCSTPGLPVHHHLPELAQTHVHCVSEAIKPSHPLSAPSPPAVNLSQHQGFFPNQSALRIRWPKCWSFSFSISPSNVAYSGLISPGLTGLILSAAWKTSLPFIPRSETSARKMGMSGILSGFPSYTTGHSAPGLGSSAPSVSERCPWGLPSGVPRDLPQGSHGL